MKKIFRNALLCGGLLATITACNTESSIAPLEVTVRAQSTSSRAGLIDGQVMPSNSSIGVTLVENTTDATSYDDNLYSNLEYSSTDGREWNFQGTNVPMLTSTEGKAIAYYPYVSGADYKALAVDILTQNDYMYSGWYGDDGTEKLDNSNPEAKFELKHVLSAFRIKLLKDESYKATARVTKIVITSGSFNTNGTYSAEDGTYSAKSGAGTYTYNFTQEESKYPELTEEVQSINVMVVPADEVPDGNKVTFTVTIEDKNGNTKDYVVAPDFATVMLQGKIYEFTLTLWPTEMTVGDVSVKTWEVVPNNDDNKLVPADLNTGN